MFPVRPRAVVTGAGSGLGRALSKELARRGARLVLADIQPEGAEQTAAMLRGAEAHVVRCDVAKLDDVTALGEAADTLLGGVDVVINNAGVAVAGLVGEIEMEDWRWIMGVNLWGVIHGCHVFVPRMKKQGSGFVLNVASAAGLLCTPNMAPYNVTKAGVVALSETLAAEVADAGIHVSALCPTFFRTNIVASGRGKDPDSRALIEKLMDRSPLQADEVAKIALDELERGTIHILPHPDGRWMWRVKRAAPDRFHEILPKLLKLRSKMALRR